jgi:hypothetical protein
MRPRTSTRPITVVGLAFAGALAGHALAYAWLIPGAAQRASVLEATGHGYLATADGFATLAGFVSLAAVFLRRLVAPRGGELSFASLFARIAGFQVLAFATMEAAERLHVGASLADLVRVLPAGTVVEIVVATLVATVLRTVLRAAETVADTIARGAPPPPRPALVHLGPSFADLRPAVAAARWDSRAPPRAIGL